MATPIPPTVQEPSPDEHIKTLVTMAEALELSAKWLNKPTSTSIGRLHSRRAAAIRWLLAETAHGVDVNELPQ